VIGEPVRQKRAEAPEIPDGEIESGAHAGAADGSRTTPPPTGKWWSARFYGIRLQPS